MTVKQIVFTQKDTAKLLETELRDIKPDEVLVKTHISTISCGTEKANITGDVNISIHEAAKAVAEFPRYAGYSTAGVVVKVGDEVETLKVGDKVAMYGTNHCEYNIATEKTAVKIPEGVSFNEAAMCFIGSFSIAALRKSKIEIGESCLITGLGILGQLAVQYARVCGAVPIIVADMNPQRREMALEYGADYALDPTAPDFVKTVKELTNGGVNVALEISGVGAGLLSCLDCMASFGRVVLEGCTRNCDFTVDFYRRVHGNGVSIIGANSNARPREESSKGLFTTHDDIKTILNLCKGKRVDMMSLVKEIHTPKDCEEVYTRLVTDRNFPVCVQFDWEQL